MCAAPHSLFRRLLQVPSIVRYLLTVEWKQELIISAFLQPLSLYINSTSDFFSKEPGLWRTFCSSEYSVSSLGLLPLSPFSALFTMSSISSLAFPWTAASFDGFLNPLARRSELVGGPIFCEINLLNDSLCWELFKAALMASFIMLSLSEKNMKYYHTKTGINCFYLAGFPWTYMLPLLPYSSK